MSPPAVNAAPAPRRMIARIASSSRPSSSNSSRSRSRAGMVTRFSFSGTSSVIVATRRSSSRSSRSPCFRSCLHLLIAEQPAEDLPRRALRQRVDEAILARALEAGERGSEAVRVELFLRGRRDDDGDDALPQPVVLRRRRPQPRARRGGPRARPRLRAGGRSRRPRRSCRRRGRRSRGRRRRRDGRCRPCGTSRRESPSRPRRGGSSSRRRPRRRRGAPRSRPSTRRSRVLTAGRPAQPGLPSGPARS